MNKIDWTQTFPIASLDREIVKQAGFTTEQIEMLTDGDMRLIAKRMWYTYFYSLYWKDLRFQVGLMLKFK